MSDRDTKNFNKKPRQPEPFGLRVIVEDGNVEKALRKFKRKVNNDGKLQDYRARQEFTPKVEVRKTAKAAAKARWRREQRKNEMPKRLY